MRAIFLGGYSHNVELLEPFSNATDAFLILEKRDYDSSKIELQKLVSSGRTLLAEPSDKKNHQDFFPNIRPSETNFEMPELEVIDEIRNSILNDFCLPLLTSRFDYQMNMSPFRSFCTTNDLIDHAIETQSRYKFKEIYAAYLPHTLVSHIFFRTLEITGAKVYRLTSSEIPWIFLPVKGLIESTLKYSKQMQKTDGTDIAKFIEHQNKTYDEAIPYYEKKAVNELASLRKAFAMIVSPKQTVRFLNNYFGRQRYERMAVNEIGEPRYAVFFLHFQPEANTLPGAGFLIDQFQAIKKLRLLMPNNVTLFVREHPSTFTKRKSVIFRPKGFYKRIVGIENVSLISTTISAFDLIDNAKFVASLSGNVLTEALTRKKPIVKFLQTKFANSRSSAICDWEAKDSKQIKQVIRQYCEDGFIFPFEEVVASLQDTEANGYSGSHYDDGIKVIWPKDEKTQRKLSITAHKTALIEFLDNRMQEKFSFDTSAKN